MKCLTFPGCVGQATQEDRTIKDETQGDGATVAAVVFSGDCTMVFSSY